MKAEEMLVRAEYEVDCFSFMEHENKFTGVQAARLLVTHPASLGWRVEVGDTGQVLAQEGPFLALFLHYWEVMGASMFHPN